MTQRSQVRVPPGRLSSNNLEQVIYTPGAQANSAFHPSGIDKSVAIVPITRYGVMIAGEHCGVKATVRLAGP